MSEVIKYNVYGTFRYARYAAWIDHDWQEWSGAEDSAGQAFVVLVFAAVVIWTLRMINGRTQTMAHNAAVACCLSLVIVQYYHIYYAATLLPQPIVDEQQDLPKTALFRETCVESRFKGGRICSPKYGKQLDPPCKYEMNPCMCKRPGKCLTSSGWPPPPGFTKESWPVFMEAKCIDCVPEQYRDFVVKRDRNKVKWQWCNNTEEGPRDHLYPYQHQYPYQTYDKRAGDVNGTIARRWVNQHCEVEKCVSDLDQCVQKDSFCPKGSICWLAVSNSATMYKDWRYLMKNADMPADQPKSNEGRPVMNATCQFEPKSEARLSATFIGTGTGTGTGTGVGTGRGATVTTGMNKNVIESREAASWDLCAERCCASGPKCVGIMHDIRRLQQKLNTFTGVGVRAQNSPGVCSLLSKVYTWREIEPADTGAFIALRASTLMSMRTYEYVMSWPRDCMRAQGANCTLGEPCTPCQLSKLTLFPEWGRTYRCQTCTGANHDCDFREGIGPYCYDSPSKRRVVPCTQCCTEKPPKDESPLQACV